ncbi:MAG: 2-phospho-L-lactate transferase [Chloroflexi bacterium]|jgi:LPPG:FO 2-phospho-L-lactate transferase|nr:2-phospho-L-lactate transferase [Chloroflexota bacterium]
MRKKVEDLKVVALAGGVGGAKLVLGLDHVLKPGNLSVVVNTGDDFEHFGLKICPDLDTICYTLADLVDTNRGWGLANETYQVSQYLADLDAPGWFTLGDKDIAVHMERTRLLKSGWTLSQVTQDFCEKWDIETKVHPMSDSAAPTHINTKNQGLMSFQEYFVKHQFQPEVVSVVYERVLDSSPSQAVINAIEEADFVVICPSNPILSIEPILRYKEIRDLLTEKKVIAVSPLIQGQALKGPAAKMYDELGFVPEAYTVLLAYQDFLDLFIYDELDDESFPKKKVKDIITSKAQTIMKTKADKIALARVVLEQGIELLGMA